MKLLAPLLFWLSAVARASGRLSDVTVARINGAATDCTDYTHAIQLHEGVFLLYLLTETSLSVRLEVAREEKWVAFGVAPDERGKMVGSDAVVGLPRRAVSRSNPGKYYMVGEDDEDGVFLRGASEQTLQNADVWQQNGSTFLAFTKLLDEGNDEHVWFSSSDDT